MKRFFSAKVLSSVFLSSAAVSLTASAVGGSTIPSNLSRNFTGNYLNTLNSVLSKPFLKSNQAFLNTLVAILISSFLVLKIKFAMTNFLNKEKLANKKIMERIEKELEDKKKLLNAAVSYIDKNGGKAFRFENGNNKDTENKKLIEKVKQLETSSEKFKAQCKKLMNDLKELSRKVNFLAQKDLSSAFFNENRFTIENLNIHIYNLCCKISAIRGSYDVRNDISKVLNFNYNSSDLNRFLLDFGLVNPGNDYVRLLTEEDIDDISVESVLNSNGAFNNVKNTVDFLLNKVNSFLENYSLNTECNFCSIQDSKENVVEQA